MPFLVSVGRLLLVSLGVSSVVDRVFAAAKSPAPASEGDVANAAAAVAKGVAVTAIVGAVAGAAAVSFARRRRGR